ncbi:MAG: Rieske 2Fe-2S domain-containing protein [Myxococcota bacterium]
MSHGYVPVQWTRPKIVFDVFVALLIVAAQQSFLAVTAATHTGATGALTREIVAMRAWGSTAFVLLTIILCIGPAARLDRRFAPLLYNRRHLGVAMWVVALMHVREVLGYYYNYTGNYPWQLMAVFDPAADVAFTRWSVPFPLFGLVALVQITLMAVTSHDFWQKTLGGTAWKWLHMGVYGAYALLVVHVVAGAMLSERHPFVLAVVGGSIALVGGLHLVAARRSADPSEPSVRFVELEGQRWVDAGRPEDIPDGAARPLCVPGMERIALVRWDGKVSALHGHCAHQRGPLYEGRVIDGALTCPWHGWQYRPGDGQSPPPFTETIPTYRVRLHEGRVLVLPKPLPPGTATEPALVPADGLVRGAREGKPADGLHTREGEPA